MTNSQKKIFFNLEIRVANDSHKKIECHETVTHADLPHSRTPVQTIGHSHYSETRCTSVSNDAQSHSGVWTCPTKAMDSLAQIVTLCEFVTTGSTTGLPTVFYFYDSSSSLVKQITTWEDACTYLSLVFKRPLKRCVELK